MPLSDAKESFARELRALIEAGAAEAPVDGDVERFAGEGGHTAVGVEEQSATAVEVTTRGEQCLLDHGSVVIAAITSCTNTSNPAVMIAAGLLAKKARERGLESQALGEDEPRARLEGRHRLLDRAGLTAPLEKLGLQPRRLRVHDLHRQLGPAARRDLARRSRRATWRSCRCCPATATSRAASTPR